MGAGSRGAGSRLKIDGSETLHKGNVLCSPSKHATDEMLDISFLPLVERALMGCKKLKIGAEKSAPDEKCSCASLKNLNAPDEKILDTPLCLFAIKNIDKEI